ncbi:MAG: hypothetical protein ACFFCW_28005, partial [Candidatus Hodarchaeota archaeon]
DTYCIITPLFYVPLGSSKQTHRFGINNLTKTHWELIYKCWKHSSQDKNQSLYLRAPNINSFTKLAILFTMKIGSQALSKRIKREYHCD